ncbi:MAG: hypothetical protein V4527_17275 [Pseudomonadota bacterium]
MKIISMNRAALVSAIFCLISLPATADPRSDALAGISRCASIADDRLFLDCLYGAAQPLRAKLGLPPAPAAQVNLVPPALGAAVAPPPAMARVAPPPRDEGFFGGILGSGKAVAPAQRMSSYAFDSHGIFSVTLSNGEVWRQVEGDSNFAQWRAPASSYLVILRSGAFGSSNLQVQGQSTTFKVERVR